MRSMVRRKQGKLTPQKNNSIDNLMRNAENKNPVPDPNRTIINITN
jgi:hypothetical protein